MNPRITEALLITLGVAYLVAFGWAVFNLTYDMWGAFVVIPPLAVLGVIGLRRMFPGELAPVGVIMSVGLFLKFGGAAARYWVGFEAYGGGIDAQRYHEYAVEKATAVWSREASVLTLIPGGTGTPFMEDLAAIIYALSGASKLGAFFVFAWIAYWGTAWFVKAACIAVPGLLQRRYALLVVLAPSLVYWPSSIGKEAWMFFTLGLATYGVARVVTGRGLSVSVVIALIGLLAAAMVRPHMAGLWMAGVLPALGVAAFARRSTLTGDEHRRRRAALIPVIAFASVGFVVAAGATLSYLDFQDEEGEVTATSIIEETARRTQQAGSSFSPPSVSNPANWPYASVRTLTRPLLIEARGSGPLLSALEMTMLIGIAALAWRRIVNLPRLLIRVPFLTFAMTVLFFGSLAFTSFANLGVLTRQRTLLFPFLLLVLCVPTRREVAEAQADLEEHDDVRGRPNEQRTVAGHGSPAERRWEQPVAPPAGWHGSVAPTSVPPGWRGGVAPTSVPPGWRGGVAPTSVPNGSRGGPPPIEVPPGWRGHSTPDATRWEPPRPRTSSVAPPRVGDAVPPRTASPRSAPSAWDRPSAKAPRRIDADDVWDGPTS